MAYLKIDKERCKSCEYCIISCKKDALSLSNETNAEGYPYVQVDGEKCVLCGICYQVCPDNTFEIVEK